MQMTPVVPVHDERNMMHILFNGDSNMNGEELENKDLSMAGVITKFYNATATNLAVSGASNDLIYDSTRQYLQTNPAPDLVVVGWTEHGRDKINSIFLLSSELEIKKSSMQLGLNPFIVFLL